MHHTNVISRIFCTFVFEFGKLFPDILEKKEALCASSIWERRKFSNGILKWHSGSHAIAWAVIITSICKVSYDLQIKKRHCGSRFFTMNLIMS